MSNCDATQKQDILDGLDRFICMQSDHLNDLASGNLARLFSMRDECQVVLHGLKQRFGSIAESAFDESGEFLALLKEKNKKIIQAEQLLETEVVKQMDSVGNKLRKIRKGKKVLSGYSLKSDMSSPRFVSRRS